MKRADGGLTLREVVLFAALGALTFAAKLVMAPIPNVEPVTLLVMLFAAAFGWRALYPIYIYVAMEYLVYGIQLWSINYLYVWLILAAASILIRNVEEPIAWAILAGIFGMLFGLFCAPVYIFVNGFRFAVMWWVQGVVFDLIHGAANFVIALVLFAPLRKLLRKLQKAPAR